MKNLLSSGWAKKILIFAFVLGLVSPSAFAYTDVAPSVLSPNTLVNINPSAIKPVVSGSGSVAAVAPQIQALGVTTITGAASVYFHLNTAAKTTVWIKDSTDTIVKTLLFDTDLAANVTKELTWNGTNNSNAAVSSGNYIAQVVAYNSVDTAVQNYSFSFTAKAATPVATAPVLSNVYFSPTYFDPTSATTKVYFTVDKPVNATVSVLNGSTIIRTLVSSSRINAGTYSYDWDGRDNSGSVVANGNYSANINVSNSDGSDTKTATVQVSSNGGNNNNCSGSLISSHYADPSSFNPNFDSTRISFNLSKSANVSVRILKNGSLTKSLMNYQSLSSGMNYAYWNGRNESGNLVSNGNYTYEIKASTGGCSEQTQSSTVTITDSNGGNDFVNDWSSTNENLINNLQVYPELFNPDNADRTTISFHLQNSAKVRVDVLNGFNVVKTIRNSDGSSQSSGNYSYTWDGRDNSGYRVTDDIYQIRVMADDGDDTDTDRADVEVDTDGIIIGLPNGSRCAGYRDVSVNSPFCKAIELMSQNNIFSGYSDGTFRPYQKINRAETAKVVVLALNYDIPTNGYFGKQYTDTQSNAWYSPYLDVAKRNNIATGYPDGSFRPANTINRVELLRVFLEANNIRGVDCSPAPFEDTPLVPDTRWYMKYACYAKNNGLMNSDNSNKLYPADDMTRGDVAELFYQFQVKGLYNNNNGNCYDYGCNNNNNSYCYDYGCTNNNSSYCNSTYSYNCNNSSNSNNQICVSRDYNGHCTQWVYDNGNVNFSNYNSSNNGYYVYQNGQYVWVSY